MEEVVLPEISFPSKPIILGPFKMRGFGKRLLIIVAALAVTSWAQVIEAHGILVQPLPGAQVAQTGSGGKNVTTSVQPEKEGANSQTEAPQTINIGGVPVQVQGQDITLNGQPIEGQTSSGVPQNGQLEVAGSDVIVNGRPVDGKKPDPGLTITQGTASTATERGESGVTVDGATLGGTSSGASTGGITIIREIPNDNAHGETAVRSVEEAKAGAGVGKVSTSPTSSSGKRRIRVYKRW